MAGLSYCFAIKFEALRPRRGLSSDRGFTTWASILLYVQPSAVKI